MGGFEHRCLGPALRLRALLIATRPGSQSVWPAVRQRSGDSERRWATEVGDALVVASLGGAFRVLAGAGKVDWVLLTTVVPRGARGGVENGRAEARDDAWAEQAAVLAPPWCCAGEGRCCWRRERRWHCCSCSSLCSGCGACCLQLWSTDVVGVVGVLRLDARHQPRAAPQRAVRLVVPGAGLLGHRTPRPPRSKDGTGRCGVLWRAGAVLRRWWAVRSGAGA